MQVNLRINHLILIKYVYFYTFYITKKKYCIDRIHT